jgi:hypothetical protein
VSRKKHFFDISNLFFWIILGVILFLLLPYFKNGFYNEKKVEDWISLFEKNKNEEIIQDTVTHQDTIDVWTWIDFYHKTRTIRFTHHKDAFEKSEQNREKINFPNFNVYQNLYEHDKLLLADFIEQFRIQIKQRKMDYFQSLNFVCSSIQYIPYTLILDDEKCPCQTDFGYFDGDCGELNSRGCCDNVSPLAVYAPVEFVMKKTGDCDTRSLLAFTILKELGFDVAIMVSESERHSVLGIATPPHRSGSIDFGINKFGKKYYLWELTSPDWRFGYGVKGNDWETVLE